MEEKIIEMLGNLGADGLAAFYVYMAVDTLQLIGTLAFTAWCVRAAWPAFKKMMDLT